LVGFIFKRGQNQLKIFKNGQILNKKTPAKKKEKKEKKKKIEKKKAAYCPQVRPAPSRAVTVRYLAGTLMVLSTLRTPRCLLG
jgi:nucleosome binding factor SPN SPT16 subunit